MCSILKHCGCVGRNFDYEMSYKEEIITVERGEFNNMYSIIGVCTGAVDDYPLLYDGMNECGLVCGGLAFEGNAKYRRYQDGMGNIPSFDFTFQVLANNKTVEEAREWLEDVNIWCEPFSDKFPNTDLHWFIADVDEAIIVEQTKDGLRWYDAETNVMTNNPPYPLQLDYYKEEKEYIGVCAYKDRKWFTRGMDTDNLSGGYTSEERFIRASYLLNRLGECESPFDDVTETFHLLSSVEQVYGATPVGDKFEYTIYSVVYDMDNLTMWVKAYDKICPSNYMMKGSERISL